MPVLFGVTNLLKAASITATSYEAALPPDNLATDQGAESAAWQTMYGTTVADLIINLTTTAYVRTIGFFRTNLTYVAQVTVAGFNGGTLVFETTVSGPSTGYRQVVVVLDAPVLVDTITVTVDDPSNTDHFINIPLMFIGDAWEPIQGFAPGSDHGFVPIVARRRSRGGQIFQTPLANPRTFNFQFDAVVDADVWQYVGEIQRLAAMGGNLLWIPDRTATEINREAVFGLITETGRVTWPGNSVGIRRWSGSIEERL